MWGVLNVVVKFIPQLREQGEQEVGEDPALSRMKKLNLNKIVEVRDRAFLTSALWPRDGAVTAHWACKF